MNINVAKTQIKNAITAYFTKDDFGKFIIPIERQRPIFLMGPPGIGKTAVMAQVAQELGVGLVSYSMTHHTRQSAIGLPFITKKIYAGQEYDVSEYTMSEIIASVYDMAEATGLAEGILFLDEVNCVSETLAPAMLQFLQYKIFGRHRIPDGWIVVTAGNPPEYNNSVREFDTVTWDRLKRIDIEPSYDAWKEYAYRKGVHPAVTTYLGIKSDDFYQMETTVDGKSFVTARGWVDLSDMIHLYEQHGIGVHEELVSQYLQNRKIAKEFATYYDLFNKYRSDYQIDAILAGNVSDEIKSRAMAAKFDERLALLGLLIDKITSETRHGYERENALKELITALQKIKVSFASPTTNAIEVVSNVVAEMERRLSVGEKASSISDETRQSVHIAARILKEAMVDLQNTRAADSNVAFQALKSHFDKNKGALLKDTNETGQHLTNIFAFCESVFPDGQELLILVTELTTGYYTAHHIARYGCDAYFKHNKELLFYERQQELIMKLDLLVLDEV